MAITPNYSWVTPAPTDFVTDLPADFEVFADAVDADLAGLLGGTTGQYLAKDTDADHDFSWVTLPPPGGLSLISTTSIPAATSVTLTSIPQSFTYLYGIIFGVQGAGSGIDLNIEPNSVNNLFNSTINVGTAASTTQNGRVKLNNTTVTHTTGDNVWAFRIDNYTSTTEFKVIRVDGGYTSPVGNPNEPYQTSGFWKSTNAITSLNVMTTFGAGFAAAGSILLYGGN